MGNFLPILFVNIDPPTDTSILSSVYTIRDWIWERTALARWVDIDTAGVATWPEGSPPALTILACSSNTVQKAVEAYYTVRKRWNQSPILLIRKDSGKLPLLDSITTGNVIQIQLRRLLEPQKIADALQQLGVTLPPRGLTVDYDPNDISVREFVESIGRDHLELSIEKHLPYQGPLIQIRSVAGGWSGAPLCRMFFGGMPQEFFFKFFRGKQGYAAEFEGHLEAQEWLGTNTVKLVPVPSLAPLKGEAQAEAFPDAARYPLCYESARTPGNPRETLKSLYTKNDEAYLAKAFMKLIKILANQPSAEVAWQVQWSSKAGMGFERTTQLKMGAMAALEDLDLYGEGLCTAPREWVDRKLYIRDFLFNQLPPWLDTLLPVTLGHSHGDPNSRNCLVDPNAAEDLLLIDCGEYQSGGRLISDLALIECDIKLVLMGTDLRAGRFFDLDSGRLDEWREEEKRSIHMGLSYTAAHARASIADPSVQLAYRLIGLVRERARTVTSPQDVSGTHYFAALLYWTLTFLRQAPVRPTKKLLAAYSASQLLGRFASQRPVWA
jgi:hypothetical protein